MSAQLPERFVVSLESLEPSPPANPSEDQDHVFIGAQGACATCLLEHEASSASLETLPPACASEKQEFSSFGAKLATQGAPAKKQCSKARKKKFAKVLAAPHFGSLDIQVDASERHCGAHPALIGAQGAHHVLMAHKKGCIHAHHALMLAMRSCSPCIHARHAFMGGKDTFMLPMHSCSPCAHARHAFMLTMHSCSPCVHWSKGCPPWVH
eukprot:scaffold124290_cov24-Tisochrysis_lutea.AAC.1